MSNYKFKGYRIDGVAACRLAWQWFHWGLHFRAQESRPMPTKQEFVDRKVIEPWAVRLAGEYDIWDKRDPDAELFQHGLRSEELYSDTWNALLGDGHTSGSALVVRLLNQGRALQFARANEYRDVITQQGFTVHFEGLTFLACNSHELDIRSHLFEAGIKPEHDALLGFTYNGKSKDWRVSMYRIYGKEADLLSIAKKHGGGGHPGACGFRTVFPVWMLPFRADGRITPQTADARVWARQWLETIHMHPELPKDELGMITWFSNAIMAGVDEADRRK